MLLNRFLLSGPAVYLPVFTAIATTSADFRAPPEKVGGRLSKVSPLKISARKAHLELFFVSLRVPLMMMLSGVFPPDGTAADLGLRPNGLAPWLNLTFHHRFA